LYSQVSSHSSHYTASSVQLYCLAKSHPTAITILTVQCSYLVQPSLIPQQLLSRKISAAPLYSQVSTHISYYSASAVLYRQVTSQSSNYTASTVQHCCTAKSHTTAVTILQVQCSFVVRSSLIPQQSVCGKLSAAVLYRQDSSQSSHYTAR